MTSTITIPVDPDTATAFAAASPKDRRAYELMLAVQLKRLTHGPKRDIEEIMDSIGAYAASQGLTEEKLEELLRDE
jgi:hypothetical protein